MTKKKHKKSNRKKKNKAPLTISKPFISTDPYLKELAEIAERRTGGSVSIQGFIYQFKYATWRLLNYFNQLRDPNPGYIHLEGVEDIDFIETTETGTNLEFAQVKYSKNKVDARTLWDSGVLQNFVEAYLKHPNSSFRLVYNMDLAKGHLSDLVDFSKNKGKLISSAYNYWKERFEEFQKEQKNKIEESIKKTRDFSHLDWDWSSFNLTDFFSKLSFERISEEYLNSEITHLIIDVYRISSGNEQLYIRSLIWYIIKNSRHKAKIKYQDLNKFIESIKEEIAKGPINPAVQGRWLEPVNFNVPYNADTSLYFEGKAAKPFHIGTGLPAHRKQWEEEALKIFEYSDVMVIRASSGQGKSTLAWQIAQTLETQGRVPYELVWCAEASQIGNIITLLESRIKIGELPLVIVDGLRADVSSWAELACRTLHLPVKYIITSREEDWYRFGADPSNLRVRSIMLEMTTEEAEDIYYQFKKAGKLHPDIGNWQSAWEKVAERRLLIEYVYLLTQGQMIEERLSYQIKELNKDFSGDVKLEILRLVSVADVCDVHLPTVGLLKSVQERIGFKGDRGECLASLQKEYYIQFEDNTYIEGLHPVRSKHLVELLHKSIPVGETLSTLLPILQADSLAEFAAHAPLMVQGKQRITFLEELANYVSKRPYFEMASIIDGLFSMDAFQHWQNNKDIYDELYERNFAVFVMDAFPWSGLKVLKDLINALSEQYKPRLEEAQALVNKIRKFDPSKSDTLFFIRGLTKILNIQELNISLNGLGHLGLWFLQFKLDCPALSKLNDADLWKAFESLEMTDSGELFKACHTGIPSLYHSFLDEHKVEIIGMLKRKTDTLTIKEEGTELSIEYLLDQESVRSPNDQSVDRLNLLGLFFPQYEIYNSKGLQPPIPGAEEFIAKYDQSVKHMHAKYVTNSFQVHVTRIWHRRISVNYESPSVYDWQSYWFEIRSKSVELTKVCISLFEKELEARNTKNVWNQLIRQGTEVLNMLSVNKEFPTTIGNNFDIEIIKNRIKNITDWASSWQNFLSKIAQILQPTENNQPYLANMNLQDTCKRLREMQDSFRFITNNTYAYFDDMALNTEEEYSYNRLASTVDFYINGWSGKTRVYNVKETIRSWHKQIEKERLEFMREILQLCKVNLGFDCIAPTKITETSNIKTAIIGIKDMKWNQLEEKLGLLMAGISDLSVLDIERYIIVPIKDDHADKPLGVSVSKDFLVRLKGSLINNTEFELYEYGNPIPFNLDEVILEPLPGISLPEQDTVGLLVGKILSNFWALAEVRNRLSKDVPEENKWLSQLEKTYQDKIEQSIADLKRFDTELGHKYIRIVNEVVEQNKPFNIEIYQNLFKEDLLFKNY